jgi:hypothetical protein
VNESLSELWRQRVTRISTAVEREGFEQEEFGFQWNELSGSQKDKIAAENEAELKRVAGEPEADGFGSGLRTGDGSSTTRRLRSS